RSALGQQPGAYARQRSGADRPGHDRGMATGLTAASSCHLRPEPSAAGTAMAAKGNQTWSPRGHDRQKATGGASFPPPLLFDDAAGNAIAGIAGRLAFVVVRIGMDHHGRAVV